MASSNNRSLLLPLLIVVISFLVLSTGIQGEEANSSKEVEFCRYVGNCLSQQQCASMCKTAGFGGRPVYCDPHRYDGPQCCCVNSESTAKPTTQS